MSEHPSRLDGRATDEPRPLHIEVGGQEFAEGSALIEIGRTRVICTASIEERVPSFLRGQGRGWVTAEYSMLPRATLTRTPRERSGGPASGRAMEIQRLIGRSLRCVTNLEKMGERTVTLDCDVLQADGGTRTAAITGAYVALYQALLGLVRRGIMHSVPLNGIVAATSVGVVNDQVLLDLSYEEDFRAHVDFNVVMSDKGDFIELQGTGEESPFSKETMQRMLTVAEIGIHDLITKQRSVIGSL